MAKKKTKTTKTTKKKALKRGAKKTPAAARRAPAFDALLAPVKGAERVPLEVRTRSIRANAQAAEPRPNPSLEPRRYGRPRRPRGALVHHAPRGRRVLPQPPSQLER